MSSQTSLRTLIVDEVDEAAQADRSSANRDGQHSGRIQEPSTRNAANGSTMKLSINVAEELGSRLRRLAFDLRVSESSIVEVALGLLYEIGDDAEISEILRSRGASLRRKRQ